MSNEPITRDSIVSKVIESYPELESTFVEFGFTKILNPIMRKTVAKHVTLSMACGMKGVDIEDFLRALNERVTEEGETE